MNKWEASCYTQVIRDSDTGDLLLHNSFMGAIARVPADVAESIARFLPEPGLERDREISPEKFEEPDLRSPALRELCAGGFFVPSDTDERLRCSPLSRQKEGLVKVEVEGLSRGGKSLLPEVDLEGGAVA